MDTVEANLALDFLRISGNILSALRFSKTLESRPCAFDQQSDKIYQLTDYGMEITKRVPIQMEATAKDLFIYRQSRRKWAIC